MPPVGPSLTPDASDLVVQLADWWRAHGGAEEPVRRLLQRARVELSDRRVAGPRPDAAQAPTGPASTAVPPILATLASVTSDPVSTERADGVCGAVDPATVIALRSAPAPSIAASCGPAQLPPLGASDAGRSGTIKHGTAALPSLSFDATAAATAESGTALPSLADDPSPGSDPPTILSTLVTSLSTLVTQEASHL